MTRKLSVLTRVSSVAIVAALTAAASAQSFKGDATVTFGTVNITEGAGTTDLDVQSTTAVIDWTPDDNAVGNFGVIAFQDSGTTANFSGASDFAVLNRINVADSTRGIFMNGNINALVDGVPGHGSVYFYSPSGFVIGSSAVINVGSLVLSASPIAVDGSGNFINGTTVVFNQAPNANALINTVAGSQIKANGSGSYVALVAPHITHHGTIRTDTAAALVAAEAATISFSPDGLFSIQIDTGTDDPNGIDIDGGTIARNDVTEGIGNHYAYLVSVAKNDAVAMLVRNGGSVGFDTATSASVEDNVVVLSGGYDVNGGSPYISNGNAPVGVTIDNATISTDVYAQVSGGALVTTSTGSTSFGNNLTIFAGDDTTIQAINGNSLAIGGSLIANVDVFGNSPTTTGNVLRLQTVSGGSLITVGGDVTLSANAEGQDAQDDGLNGGNATGGAAIVQTGSNGSISILGNLSMSADGTGGDQFFSNGSGGTGTGGTAQILANGGTGSISIGGNTFVSAEGQGGSSGECSVCNVTGGNGTGGQILIDNLGGSGNSLTFGNGDTGGDLTLDVGGFGGSGDLGGGIGTGGTAQITSGDASSVLIHSDLIINSAGNGGYGFDATGGNGLGGNAFITFSGAASTIDVEGQALIDASGSGGFGTTRGGDATGGFVNFQASSAGTLNMTTMIASASAFGGGGNIGGDAIGGNAWLQSITGGTINADSVNLSAQAYGGDANSSNGGSGQGGHVVASADGATTTITGNLFLDAYGQGGRTDGNGTSGGMGTGGQVDIFSDHGGLMTVGGLVIAGALGQGGDNVQNSASAGDGQGGQVFFQASNGASLTTSTDVLLDASGYGGFSGGDCVNCGGAGGDGTGGTVTVQVYGGTDSLVGVGGNLTATANGYGADGFGGNGGSGMGGNARIFLNQDGDIAITGGLTIAAVGNGGWQTNGLLAGNGAGGIAEIGFDSSGTTLTVGGVGDIDASGTGGSTDGDGATAGSALGGTARVFAAGGTAAFQSDLSLHANANGGSGMGETGIGNGGNAQSGATRFVVDGGTATVGGDLTLESISTGGDGLNGGDAIAFIGNDPKNTATSDARVVAGNGSITVTGFTTLDVHALGGNGANGGSGGDASAGYATVHGLNRDAGSGTVTLGDLLIDADATGGSGGTGIDGNAGTDGGIGGSAQGGFVAVTASAGDGHLSIGDTIISVSAFGGTGGDGGTGSTGTGGNGGNGGAATGGFTNNGTESGVAEALGVNNGTASFASLVAAASATGGNGGNGGSGTPSGVGGGGGSAVGGGSTLLVRGSDVTTGDVLLDASATGGDGGLSPSAPNGTGANARAGNISVVVTNRAGLPAQRGNLDAGNIIGTALATGGTGGLGNGQEYSAGRNQFLVINSDAAIATLSLVSAAADGLDPGAPQLFNSPIAIVNGAVGISGSFNFTTPGTVSVYADNGTLDAASINIGADNFIHDNDSTRPGPATFGTLSANNIFLTTGQDLIVDAHMVAQNGLGFTAPGLIDFQNVTSVNGPLTLDAGSTIDAGNLSAATLVAVNGNGNVTLGSVDATSQQALINSANGNIVTGAINAGTFIGLDAPFGGITTGNLNAGTFVIASADEGDLITGTIDAGDDVQLFAFGDVTADDVNAGTSISIESGSGALILANLTAATTINLDAPGSIGFTDVTADDLDFSAGGSVTGGNIIAGTKAGGDAGGTVTLGNINVGILQTGGAAENGFAVGIAAQGSISVGNVVADEAIGFASLANLTTGTLNAGTNVMTLIGGNTSIASITTPSDGRVYHGDVQMFLDAGGTENFDPSLVFGATPVRSGGSYTVTGAISTGRIQVGAASIGTGAITAPIGIYLDSANGTTTGALASNGLIHALSGGSIQTGNVSSSAANILFDAGSNIAAGTVGAATNAEFDAGGNVSIGNANVGEDLLVDAGGNLTTGSIVAATIHATAGGLATLNGMWQSPDVELFSNDIDIAANGGIDAGNSGSIRLVSTNATQALIGDGLSGTGYQLSNTEFGRLSSGNLEILARDDASAAIDMLIGNLTITGPLAGSTIDDPFGSVTFATGNLVTEAPGGVIRVTGSINASGFTDTNSLEFFADRFELNAETGLINITGNNNQLSGELFIAANRVHAASASILDQLAANPNYSGHEDDLNAPAAVQRPDGVIRAGSIEVFSNGPLSVLMQNTGTAATPAGFLTIGDGPLLQGAEGQVGPIEMIINGQLITQGGTLTGVDVLNFLIDANNIGFFTANSTINGCLLTGVCTGNNPIPPGGTPTPGIQDVITLIGDDNMPPPPFGNEDLIDDDDENDEGETSPIIPPNPLFDTSELSDAAGSDAPEVVGTPMRSNPGLTNNGDVDDPVSGSGNPGLMENPPPPTNNEEKQP